MLAHDLGCTVAELAQRISAHEFAQWQLIYASEQLHPVFHRLRHAQALALAAMMNGPMRKKSGGAWVAQDLMPPDPWAPVVPEPQRGGGAFAMAAYVAGLRRSP